MLFNNNKVMSTLFIILYIFIIKLLSFVAIFFFCSVFLFITYWVVLAQCNCVPSIFLRINDGINQPFITLTFHNKIFDVILRKHEDFLNTITKFF